MSRALRTTLVLTAVLAAVIAFAALRPDDRPAAVSAPEPPAGETAQETTGDDGRRTASTDGGQAAATPRESLQPVSRPRPPLLRAGTVKTLAFRRGETVAFRVRHGAEEELHVHGYDIARPLPAGRTVTVRFPARLEGIFDIELEHSHTQIGSLRVGP